MNAPQRARLLQILVEREGLTRRECADRWNLPRATADRLITDPDLHPSLVTLDRLARATGVPLFQWIELEGYDLGLPKAPNDEALRWATVVQQLPETRRLIEAWVTITPDQRTFMLAILEALMR